MFYYLLYWSILSVLIGHCSGHCTSVMCAVASFIVSLWCEGARAVVAAFSN